MPRPPLAAAVTLGLLVACQDSGPPPPPPDAGLVVRDDVRLRWQELPHWPSAEPAPPAYAEALAQWRTATTAAAYGAYDDAARAFLDAADTLRAPLDAGAAASTFGAGRCLAYENAGAVLKATNAPAAHRAALAAVDDPACRHSLERLRTRTSTSAR